MIAAERDNAGRLELADNEPYTDADFSEALSVSADVWTTARDYFLRMGMIGMDGATLVVTNYAKRQASADPTGAVRQARYRERHVTDVSNALRNGVTPPLQSRVEAEAESEVDISTTTTTAAQPSEMKVFVAIGSKKIENTCGLLSSASAADEVKSILGELYTRNVPGWLDQALNEAEGMNKRNWRYVKAILDRCLKDGTPPGAKQTQPTNGNGRSNGNGYSKPAGIVGHTNQNRPATAEERQPIKRQPKGAGTVEGQF